MTEPKTTASRRKIHLPDFVYQTLEVHCDRRKEAWGFVFTTASGRPSPRTI